jgi:large subunit ribosomal protein L15
MKLHDLRPAEGSRTARTRVGRGIAAGKGKTAGRGTKGQKARAGGSIPPWFEGGQTPLHMRIPKLRGFKNRFKIEYEVVNVGAIAAAAERGAFESTHNTGVKGKAAPVTVNQDILRAVGLVRTLNKPLKILGAGELSTPLFVVADAFTASARSKIEAAGGTVSVLEVPTTSTPALGVDGEPRTERQPRTAAGRAAADRAASAEATRRADAAETTARADEVAATRAEKAEKAPKAAKAARAEATADDAEADAEPTAAEADATAEATADAPDTDTAEDAQPAPETSGDEA